eukprot:CAMPEP_0113487356 /NCGR_PEP_ID=MMETSP0014_2-20120614/25467_1 /TAXON_ID=2857 /ORGANISM="Nitzschia sp." /LENGTH=162 /DNA_ID=CAMNT_0000381051 /DNA_START=76 /DNA_END=564 /DNA_ORIENTATION=+ /assembly_acc=CAM_ASM_000159
MTTDADSIPNDFMCPLTLTLFEDPLVSKHGHSFERRAILEWLGEGNTTCPITRKPLTPSMLFPNAALRMRVKSWEKENCYSDGDDSDDDETSGQFVCRSGADAVAADRLLISFSDVTDATSRGRRSRSSRRSTTTSTGEGRRDSTGSAQSSNTRRRRFLFSR